MMPIEESKKLGKYNNKRGRQQMSGFNQKHLTPPFPLTKIYRSLLAASIVAFGAPAVVQAQEAVNQIEEVVVRGNLSLIHISEPTRRS